MDSALSESLISTKLYVPGTRPSLVPRSRLIARLDAGLHCKLALLAAPAGSGKTTLLADWVQHLSSEREGAHLPVAWLSLEEGDSEPARFLIYLVAALQHIVPSAGESILAMLTATPSIQATTLLPTLVNDLAASQAGGVLVLDDYHTITSVEIHEALASLLDHLPPGFHLVLATREDPPLPLARMRALGQLSEIRVADLRFTPEEAAEFLHASMGLDLSSDEIAAIESRTEGWIAGLQLAALSMQVQRDPQARAAFIQAFSGSHRFVLDYLAEEVLNRLPPDLHTFLLKTSVLDRMCGPLCDALLIGDGDRGDSASARAQGTLEYLDRANLFLLPLDSERHWYRYHQLFRDLLRARLKEEDPAAVPELNRRAAVWYEESGFREQAIEHALAGADYDRAARLTGEGLRGLDRMPVHLKRLYAWFEALPPGYLRSNPRVALDYGWMMTALGRQQEARTYIEVAEEMLIRERASSEAEEAFEQVRQVDSMLGEAAAASASLASQQGDLQATIDASERALKLLPAENLSRRAAVYFYLATAYQMRGDLTEAARNYAEAEKYSRHRGDNYITLLVIVQHAGAELAAGRLHEATRACLRALDLPGVEHTPFSGIAQVVLGLVLSEWNELEQAVEHLEKGIALQEPIRDWNTNMTAAHAELARIKQTLGDSKGALAEIEKAEELASRSGRPGIAGPAEWARVRYFLAAGDQAGLAAAGRWADGFRLRSAGLPTYRREAEAILVSRVRIAQGLLTEALRTLAGLREEAAAGGRNGRLLEILVLQAMALARLGDSRHAMATIGEALALAEPGGYVRLFLDEGPLMAGLLSEAFKRGIARESVLRLMPHIEAAVKAPSEAPGPASESRKAKRIAGGLIEPLTEREQQVLRLLVDGLSGPEIASILVVGESTIKTHLKNIYGKLGVHSRDQALLRARELNLL